MFETVSDGLCFLRKCFEQIKNQVVDDGVLVEKTKIKLLNNLVDFD